MRLSTRNQLTGVITEVSRGAVKVELDGGEQVEVAIAIEVEAVEQAIGNDVEIG